MPIEDRSGICCSSHASPNATSANGMADRKTECSDSLNARSKPVHYKELTTAIEKRGLYKTRSKNLLSTVAVTLKRDRRFRKVEPGIYALRKK